MLGTFKVRIGWSQKWIFNGYFMQNNLHTGFQMLWACFLEVCFFVFLQWWQNLLYSLLRVMHAVGGREENTMPRGQLCLESCLRSHSSVLVSFLTYQWLLLLSERHSNDGSFIWINYISKQIDGIHKAMAIKTLVLRPDCYVWGPQEALFSAPLMAWRFPGQVLEVGIRAQQGRNGSPPL